MCRRAAVMDEGRGGFTLRGPGKFSHVNVSGAGGLFRARRKSLASDSFCSAQCSGLEAVPGTGVTELACASVSSSLCASVSSESRRMAFGIWPRGLWNLAVWPLDSRRVAFPHFTRLGLGLRTLQGRMVCNLPGPCPTPVPNLQWCPMCPHPAGLRLPSWRALMVLPFHW